PDIESSITSNANTSAQGWGHRRFVSRPLAAQSIPFTTTNWTFSYARSESNLNHNQSVCVCIYAWRPSTGAQVGTFGANQDVVLQGTEPTSASTEQAESVTGAGAANVTIQDGDILVFDVATNFTQVMATAYTD